MLTRIFCFLFLFFCDHLASHFDRLFSWFHLLLLSVLLLIVSLPSFVLFFLSLTLSLPSFVSFILGYPADPQDRGRGQWEGWPLFSVFCLLASVCCLLSALCCLPSALCPLFTHCTTSACFLSLMSIVRKMCAHYKLSPSYPIVGAPHPRECQLPHRVACQGGCHPPHRGQSTSLPVCRASTSRSVFLVSIHTLPSLRKPYLP
jgi:hypothetical protein